jgi:predicted PurR-regulated permease PerM
MAQGAASETALPGTNWKLSDTARATLTVVGVVLMYGVLYAFGGALFYLFVAVILATALEPIIRMVERLKLSRNVAAPIVYVTVTLVGGGLAVYGLPILVEQVQSLIATTPEAYHSLRDKLAASSNELLARLGSSLPEHLGVLAVSDAADKDVINLSNVAKAVTLTKPLIHGVFVTVAVLVLAFFWSLQGQRMLRSSVLWMSPPKREPAREFFDAVLEKVGAFVRGQGILCLSVAAMTLVALLIIGVPNAFALALLAGMLEAVPVLGPTLGAVPAVLVAASVDTTHVFWVIMAAIVIQQTENYVLVPRIMDRSVGVNPLVTLLALAGFGSLLGLPGMVLAIPMAAIIQLILERAVLNADAHAPPPPTGRGPVSRLRYQVHELLQDVRRVVRVKEGEVAKEADRIEEEVERIAQELDDRLLAEETPTAPAPQATAAKTPVEPAKEPPA